MICPADPYVVLIISALYTIFAAQLFHGVTWAALWTPVGRVVSSLILVFVFCSWAGYLSTLFPQYPQICTAVKPTMWYVREVSHYVLAVATAWLVLTNQAGILARFMVMYAEQYTPPGDEQRPRKQ